MQSSYLCVIFLVKNKKSPFLAILTWFLILGKIQDGDYCWWRHTPPAALSPLKHTSSCLEDQRLCTQGKIVSKYYNILKTPGEGFHPPPPPPRGLNKVITENRCAYFFDFFFSVYTSFSCVDRLEPQLAYFLKQLTVYLILVTLQAVAGGKKCCFKR